MSETIYDEVVGDLRRVIERGLMDGRSPKWWYVLVGPHGATQYVHADYSELNRTLDEPVDLFARHDGWYPVDVGYHSPEPRFDGHHPIGVVRWVDGEVRYDGDPDPCPWVDGPCYYDGSSLRAEPLLETWLASDRNDEVIWRYLWIEYQAVFLAD